MAKIGSDIIEAATILRAGGLVAIPTETVYGLAGNAFDENAVLSIFKAKDRPSFDPLIVHIKNQQALTQLVKDIPAHLQTMIDDLWPGPLTILLDKRANVSDLITSGLTRVAVRIPRHAITESLLHSLEFPIAAPSANPFGYISPTTARHVQDQLGDKVDYILDGGPADVGIESTIIGIENEKIVIYRLGGTSLETLSQYGEVTTSLNNSSNPQAPGMLKSHYAPSKPMLVGNIEELVEKHGNKTLGIISFSKLYTNVAKCEVLSERGNLDEAARQMFGALRRLDQENIDLILTEPFPNTGVGRAINDRFQRAAVR
ncbi:MAG: L-threonylcarbamoyladenylate synthase [Cyclobacteriaceae bacterium]|jgi:L-threonylcarbamoyladenylate synthase